MKAKGGYSMTKRTGAQYETLSPWAEADPPALKGISPRIGSLEGKKIGLLRNSKRAALPILGAVEKRLKERFPTAEFTEFANLKPNETITEQDARGKFEDWLKGVDAVVTAFGD
jgi:hypothetical protein